MFDPVDLGKLGERCRQAADVDVSGLSDDELLAATLEWQAIASAAELGAGQALGELQKRGCTEARFGLKTAGWVAAEANIDRRVVARRLRSGRHLRFLPQVCDAVVAGELTSDHASEMALASSNPRIGDQIVAGQAFWVELARSTSFVAWQHQLRHTVAELDQDGGYDPNRDLARNTLHLTSHPDGLLSFGGELAGERALAVGQAVESHADTLYRRLKHDRDLCPELPLPKRATVLAMALAELVMRGASVDRDKTPGPAIDITLVIEATPTNPTDTANRSGATGAIETTGTGATRSSGSTDTTGTGTSDANRTAGTHMTGTRDADSTTEAAGSIGATDTAGTRMTGTRGADSTTEAAGSIGTTGTEGTTGGPTAAATVSLHGLDHDGCGDHTDPRQTGPQDDDHHGDRCCGDGQGELARLLASRPVHTPDGHRVPAHVAAALVCDPVITALIVDTLGVPLDLGREIRFANRNQRRALARRDGGCVFPGCDAPVGWCDAHHVTWWDNGGNTDIAELALLCRYHHGITHRHGWTMTAHPDHTFTWTTPHDQTLTSQRHRGRSPTP